MNSHGDNHDTNPAKIAGTSAGTARAAAADDVTLRRIGEALRGLRYGSVLTIVQDGVVVQIERTEKTRFQR